jgi:hypothetical protein
MRAAATAWALLGALALDGRILVAGSIYSSQGLARYLP